MVAVKNRIIFRIRCERNGYFAPRILYFCPMNTIALRIYDFLKNFPPFDLLKRGELLDLCSKIVVKYIELNAEVFHEGDGEKNNTG